MDFFDIFDLKDPIILIMLILAVLSFVSLIIVFVVAKRFDKKITKDSETAFKKEMYYWMDVPYTIFTVFISLFPLLGMLGTVIALRTLNISNDAIEELKPNFFQALNTTIWGLVFAIIFKFINAFLQTYFEGRIAKAKNLLENGEDNE